MVEYFDYFKSKGTKGKNITCCHKILQKHFLKVLETKKINRRENFEKKIKRYEWYQSQKNYEETPENNPHYQHCRLI